MAARVIHVGTDICHRLPVLESAGYEVDTCISMPEFRTALTSRKQVDAVLISEGAGGAHPDAVLLARSHSSAPIVLFRETQLNFAESSFDLVVPILISPQVWLEDIAALIARSRMLRTESQSLCQQSAGVAVAEPGGPRQLETEPIAGQTQAQKRLCRIVVR